MSDTKFKQKCVQFVIAWYFYLQKLLRIALFTIFLFFGLFFILCTPAPAAGPTQKTIAAASASYERNQKTTAIYNQQQISKKILPQYPAVPVPQRIGPITRTFKQVSSLTQSAFIQILRRQTYLSAVGPWAKFIAGDSASHLPMSDPTLEKHGLNIVYENIAKSYVENGTLGKQEFTEQSLLYPTIPRNIFSKDNSSDMSWQEMPRRKLTLAFMERFREGIQEYERGGGFVLPEELEVIEQYYEQKAPIHSHEMALVLSNAFERGLKNFDEAVQKMLFERSECHHLYLNCRGGQNTHTVRVSVFGHRICHIFQQVEYPDKKAEQALNAVFVPREFERKLAETVENNHQKKQFLGYMESRGVKIHTKSDVVLRAEELTAERINAINEGGIRKLRADIQEDKLNLLKYVKVTSLYKVTQCSKIQKGYSLPADLIIAAKRVSENFDALVKNSDLQLQEALTGNRMYTSLNVNNENRRNTI